MSPRTAPRPRFYSGKLVRARFIERPNRFVVWVRLRNGRRVKAYMPNPGRLQELLLPDAELYLEKKAPALDDTKVPRRTDYTILAVEREGAPVFLHTHRTNDVAAWLLGKGLVPGLEKARPLAAEVKHGRSRFDFLMEEKGRRFFLEVKSVTLFGNGAAMFPDAVTERGRRHILELAEMPPDVRPVTLFLVHSLSVDRFLPDYHTDLAFSQAFVEVGDRVRFLPLSIGWNKELELEPEYRLLNIPWKHIAREARDRGAYLLILRLKKQRSVGIGSLGEIVFKPGYYVYVGSAMQNLSARVRRHLSRRKRMHWHIDYLREAADEVKALPIRGSLRRECEIARAADKIMDDGPIGFGCSDCNCEQHLFHSPTNPLDRRDFHALLESFRMQRPEEQA